MVTGEKEVYLAVLIAVSFLAVILIFSILNLLIVHRKIRRLQKNLISAEIITLENERKRFSSDIHDEIAPTLSVAMSLVDSLNVAQEDTERQQMAVQVLKDSVQQIRHISRNIIPRHIQEMGLHRSLEKLVWGVRQSQHNKIDVRLYADAIYDAMTEEKMVNIYRIVQEGLTNAIKHSGATQIQVHLSRMEDHLAVTISDNGSGFDFSLLQLTQQPQDKGIGLKNIHNRVLLLGGKLYINSKINFGTQIIAEIPL